MLLLDRQRQESRVSLTPRSKLSAKTKTVSPDNPASPGGVVAAAATASLASVVPVTEQAGKPCETGSSSDELLQWALVVAAERSYFKIGV